MTHTAQWTKDGWIRCDCSSSFITTGGAHDTLLFWIEHLPPGPIRPPIPFRPTSRWSRARKRVQNALMVRARR